MEKQYNSLFHDRTERFCRLKRNQKYSFTLRCANDDSISVLMCVNGSKNVDEYKMTLDRVDKGFAYYECEPFISDKVISYYFKIEKEGETLYYDALGASDKFQEKYFCFTPGFKTPDWAKGAVMYQIMVDRFANGDPSNDVVSEEYAYINSGVCKVEDWYKTPAEDGTREFYGGDLQGVIDHLDYLKDLGVEVIYFNPLFVSPSNHKYDTQDYDYIDPHIGKIINDGGEKLEYGEGSNERAELYIKRTTDKENLKASNELFIELVDKAHKKGIKVVIDGVFNHCGSFNKWLDREKIYSKVSRYKAGAFESKESPYVSFFKFTEDKWPDNYCYEGWWGFDTLPKLNYEESPALCEYILNIGKKWVSPPYNADGWRLDVAADLGHSEEFNHKFWKRFRKAVKKANPEAIIIAEHYGDASKWLRGDEWDSVMNYDAFMDPVSWFLTGVDKHSDNTNFELKGNAKAFVKAMDENLSNMQSESQFVAMNELSNHDHSRFLTRTNGKTGRIATAGPDAASWDIDYGIFKQGVIMQMTLPGAPTVYYGDEAGLVGWTDPDNRRTYPWGKENIELIEFYKKAIKFHKKYDELKNGSYINLVYEDDLLAYGRFDDKNAIVVAVNTSDDHREFNIPVWKMGLSGNEYYKIVETWYDSYDIKDLLKDATIKKVEDGYLKVSVSPKGTAILKKK